MMDFDKVHYSDENEFIEDLVTTTRQLRKSGLYGPQPWWNPTLWGRYKYATRNGYSDSFAMVFMRQSHT
jgi:hypothetical protein